MSDVSELITDYEAIYTNNYIGFSTIAFIVYEYVITFGLEVELFWKQKITSASVLFFVNRYLVLCYNLSLLRQFRPFTEFWVNGTRAVEISCYLPWAAFSALRVFALSGRNWVLSSTVFLLSCVPIGINFADFHFSTVAIDPIWGCIQDLSSEPASLSIQFTAISRGSLIISDIIVIIVTWVATYRTMKIARSAFNGPSLSILLFRDGMIYFIVMLVMNVLHLSFSTSSFLVDLNSISYAIYFTEPLTSILVSRFLLDLQETNSRQLGVNSTIVGSNASDGSSTIRFDRIIGSLGDSILPSRPVPAGLMLDARMDDFEGLGYPHGRDVDEQLWRDLPGLSD